MTTPEHIKISTSFTVRKRTLKCQHCNTFECLDEFTKDPKKAVDDTNAFIDLHQNCKIGKCDGCERETTDLTTHKELGEFSVKLCNVCGLINNALIPEVKKLETLFA